MTDTPKFSLLNAARSQQNAQAKPPTKPVESKPIPQPIQQIPSKTGLLGGGKALLGGGTKTPTQPSQPATSSPSQANVPVSTSLVSNASGTKGGLLGGLEKAKANQEIAKAEHDKLFMEPPKDFRELLDSFDKFFAEDTGISEFNLAPARDFVERIFNDLRVDPSLDGLLKDKDIGNVIEWVSKVKGEALAAGVQKKEKAEKKASQPKARNRFGDTGSIDLTVIPTGVKELSDFGDM